MGDLSGLLRAMGRGWLFAIGFVAGFATPVLAQTDENLPWSDYTMPLSGAETGYPSGEGWDWIEARARGSQFVLFGEQHGVEGVPIVVAASIDVLAPIGYDHLALEASPWLGEQMSRRGVTATLEQFPYELAFDENGMVALFEHAESRFSVPGDRFWGLDQPVTAIHSFQRLAKILPHEAARRTARGLMLKAALQRGRYLRHDHAADFDRLADRAGEGLTDEAAMLLDTVETSMEIYVAYLKGQRGEGPRGHSDSVREQFMKDQVRHRLSQQQGTVPHRAVFLMGGAHLMRGVGPNGVVTVGDFASDLAAANGLSTLHIGIRRFDPAVTPAIPGSLFADGTPQLIDVAGMAAAIGEEALTGLPEGMVRDFRQFDALIYLPEAPAAARGVMRGREAVFEKRLLTQLAYAGLPVLVLLSLWIPFLRMAVAGSRRHPNPLMPVLPWGIVAGAALVMLTISGVQITRVMIPGSAGAMVSGGLSPVLVAPGLSMVVGIVAIFALVRGWWGVFARTHFLLAATGVMGLGWWMWHWNIGGMLG